MISGGRRISRQPNSFADYATGSRLGGLPVKHTVTALLGSKVRALLLLRPTGSALHAPLSGVF